MTKKKLKILTALCTLLFFVISGVFLFLISYNIKPADFNMNIHDHVANMERYIESSNDIYSERTQCDLDSYLYDGVFLNAVYALMDSDGNLIAKSSPCIQYQTDNGQFMIDMEPYFTDEIYEQIRKYTGTDNIYVKSISVHKEDKKLIPVEGVFFNRDANINNPDNLLKIRFTDYEADLTLTYEANRTWTYCFPENRSRFYDKYFNHINNNLISFISEFKATHSKQSITSGSDILLDKEAHYQREVPLYNTDAEGVEHTLVLYVEAEQNLVYDTLTSSDFCDLLFFMAGLYFVIGLIIYLIASRLIKKNEMMVKSRTAFVSTAAHELKTPLAVIANNCECILENVTPEKNNEYITTVYDECKRMNRMVKGLLEYNRLNTDEKIRKEKADLGEIISREVSKFSPLIEAKQIELSTAIPEKIQLKCDEKLIGMVIGNLLSNAVKFTPEGGKIKITASKMNGKVSFEVFNSGSRISSEDAPHIWEELYSGSKSRSRDENSTGMGLAVSRVILDLHGFEYGFRNTADGVRFFFCN